MLENLVGAVVGHTFEHENLGFGEQPAQGDAFAVSGREEVTAAGVVQRSGNALDAQSIGVGLDHRGAARGRNGIAAMAVVRAQRIEIDGDQCAHVEALPMVEV